MTYGDDAVNLEVELPHNTPIQVDVFVRAAWQQQAVISVDGQTPHIEFIGHYADTAESKKIGHATIPAGEHKVLVSVYHMKHNLQPWRPNGIFRPYPVNGMSRVILTTYDDRDQPFSAARDKNCEVHFSW